ncbi:MAG: PD40 domain-containing protein [Actinobacteria bacterium]|nr:PD40 domain-containing protein [Actinomycetota bacterium]
MRPIRFRIPALAALLGVFLFASPADASFPGANGKIAFSTTRGGGDYSIYSMNPDGTGIAPLIEGPWNDSVPAYSADGTRIAFQSNRNHLPWWHFDIFVASADGTGQTRLTTTGTDGAPAWSPDGTRIAFVRHWWGADVFVMGADGSNQVNITNAPGNDSEPVWSPDGSRIAFSSDRVGGYYALFLMDPDGTDVVQLTWPGIGHDQRPSWSPDGSRIVFYRYSYSAANGDIYVVDADGSNVTRLTTDPAVDFTPQWSPDGTEILFMSDRDGNQELYLMNPDGSGQTRITFDPAADQHSSWQPLPPREGIQTLVDRVADLVRSGSLGAGNGNALTGKLEAARASLDRESPAAAVGQLGAFINQLEALGRARKLDAAVAEPLIATARAIVLQLGG